MIGTRVAAILLSISLGAQPQPLNSQTIEAASVGTASPSAERFLRRIYARYGHRPAGEDASVSSPWQRPGAFFTPRTTRIIESHRQRLVELGHVDGDPFCDCQEWTALTVEHVATRALARGLAVATVAFSDGDRSPKIVSFRLRHLGKNWRIDDMTLLGTSPDGWLVPTLSAELAGLAKVDQRARR